MDHDEQLSTVWKYYIAIMAISCYECDYLLKILEEQFLHYGGNLLWLNKGLKAVDKKLQKLADINEILAFRPWDLDSADIVNLVKD